MGIMLDRKLRPNPASTMTCFAAEDGAQKQALVLVEQLSEPKRRQVMRIVGLHKAGEAAKF
jgi:hypothetical protein